MSSHESFFSHNITRPYLFRWFTPVVLGGGIIITVLVSFLNVAASGYELATTSSTDPKGVRSGAEWFDSWPKWLASTRASCEPATLPLQTGLYTNKTAFLYTLTSVHRGGGWLSGLGKESSLGALIYDDDPLSWCNVTSLRINIESNQRTSGLLAQSWFGAALTMNIECLIERPGENATYLDLFTTYAFAPQGVGSASGNNEASVFGDTMLLTYWDELATKYYLENVNLDRPFYKAEVALTRTAGARSVRPVTVEQIMDMDFLSVDGCWLVPLNSTGFSHADEYCNGKTISELAQNGTENTVLPSIWKPLSMLGTAMWFSVLADLGRDDHILPNILAHPQEVRNLTRLEFFDGVDDVSQFTITPSVLSTTYIGQVPKLKSTGALIVSVLVADLVLLQTIWKVFVLVVDYFLVSKKEGLILCEGCVRNLKEQEKSDSEGSVKSRAPDAGSPKPRANVMHTAAAAASPGACSPASSLGDQHIVRSFKPQARRKIISVPLQFVCPSIAQSVSHLWPEIVYQARVLQPTPVLPPVIIQPTTVPSFVAHKTHISPAEGSHHYKDVQAAASTSEANFSPPSLPQSAVAPNGGGMGSGRAEGLTADHSIDSPGPIPFLFTNPNELADVISSEGIFAGAHAVAELLQFRNGTNSPTADELLHRVLDVPESLVPSYLRYHQGLPNVVARRLLAPPAGPSPTWKAITITDANGDPKQWWECGDCGYSNKDRSRHENEMHIRDPATALFFPYKRCKQVYQAGRYSEMKDHFKMHERRNDVLSSYSPSQ